MIRCIWFLLPLAAFVGAGCPGPQRIDLPPVAPVETGAAEAHVAEAAAILPDLLAGMAAATPEALTKAAWLVERLGALLDALKADLGTIKTESTAKEERWASTVGGLQERIADLEARNSRDARYTRLGVALVGGILVAVGVLFRDIRWGAAGLLGALATSAILTFFGWAETWAPYLLLALGGIAVIAFGILVARKGLRGAFGALTVDWAGKTAVAVVERLTVEGVAPDPAPETALTMAATTPIQKGGADGVSAF